MATLDNFPTEATTIGDTDLMPIKVGTGANSDKRITGANVKALFATAAQGTLAASALQDVVDDTTPTLGGPLDGDGNDLTNLGVVFLTEQAAAEADVAGKGQFWVKTATPNEAWFTDDAGNDFNLLTPEGTAVLSTGEAGGTKFLREDGDGTCSWQDIPAPEGTSVLSTGPATDGYVLTADGAGGAAWEAGGGSVDWTSTQTNNLSAATGDEVAFDFSSTVNKATSGNYTLIKANAVETSAPGSSDLLMALQVGGTSKFEIRNVPTSTRAALYLDASGVANPMHIQSKGQFGNLDINEKGGSIEFTAPASAGVMVGGFHWGGGVIAPGNKYLGWAAAGSAGTLANQPPTRLYVDADYTIAQRNSTNAQTFRVYATYTDSSNYERLAVSGSAITVETAGTGTDDIDLTLTPAGAGLVKFGTHSAIGAESVTGYITIKTADGTTRKLAVVS